MGLFQKKNKQKGLRTYFFETLPGIVYLVYRWKFRTNQSHTPGNCAKLHYIPWKFQDQKPRPLEIPHNFFLVTLGNSICYFFDTLPPGDSISSTHPVRFLSGIGQCKEGVYFFFHLILVVTSSILILSVKNRGVGFFLLNGQNPLSVTKVICQQSLN